MLGEEYEMALINQGSDFDQVGEQLGEQQDSQPGNKVSAFDDMKQSELMLQEEEENEEQAQLQRDINTLEFYLAGNFYEDNIG